MRKLLFALAFVLLAAGSTSGQAARQSTAPQVSVCEAAATSLDTPGLPDMSLGVVDDSFQTADCDAALANMQRIKDAGYNVIRLSTDRWGPGVSYPRDPKKLQQLKVTVGAAKLVSLGVIVNTSPDWNPKAKNLHMPLAPHDRQQFATWATGYIRQIPGIDGIEVGIEPNSGHFWPHQCTPGGQNDAAVAYTRLVAATYGPLKMAAEARGRPLKVIVGELSSHGKDNCQSSSPIKFIHQMGLAMRSMGCTGPIMDWFSIHPYGVNNPESPDTEHKGGTIGLADIPKLREALKKAFRGTCQPADPPIILTEWGVETVVPQAEAGNYVGRETVVPVSFAVQIRFTELAIQLALKWKVKGFFLFLMMDEPRRGRWQSGEFYFAPADSSGRRQLLAKPSEPAISRALQEAQETAARRRQIRAARI